MAIVGKMAQLRAAVAAARGRRDPGESTRATAHHERCEHLLGQALGLSQLARLVADPHDETAGACASIIAYVVARSVSHTRDASNRAP